MADITVPDRIPLVVIPGIHLLEVGEEWPASTGPWTVTPEDIAAAVAAQDDPAVRSPIIRLGHVRTGQPAFGRFTNLRAENEGMTLVADLVGAPTWLADLLPYAFPSRSVEAVLNASTETGHTHACRIDAVALLGVELPAISTLEDVRAVYAATSMEEAGVTLSTEVAAARGGAVPPVQVSAALSTEDLRRAYYDQLGPGQMWWWIREMQLDPMALIVDDDEGGLWLVPVTISGDTPSFGDPEAVRVEYVPAPVAATSATPADRRSIVFADRAASREGVSMNPAEYRRLLGLPEDATDEQVTERAAELMARPETAPTPEPETAPTPEPVAASQAQVPPGFVLVSAANWEQVQANAEAGAAASQALAQQAEDQFITRHRHRIGAAGNPHAQLVEAGLRERFRSDRAAAETFASSLAQVVPTTAPGHDAPGGEGDANNTAWDEFERRMFPDVAAVRAEQRS